MEGKSLLQLSTEEIAVCSLRGLTSFILRTLIASRLNNK